MLNKLIKGIMGIILICIFFSQSLHITSIFAILVFAAFMYVIYKIPMKEKYFIAILVLLVFFSRVLSIYWLQTPLESDFQTMFQISKELVEGNCSETSHNYMNTYSYQVPYILYQAVLLFISPELIFLKCLNVLYSIITILLLYSIAKKIASRGAARIVTAFYATMVFPIAYVNIISNQWISTISLLLGIRILLANWNKHENWKALVIGICIGIAALLRPDAIVTVLAVVAYFIYLWINKKEKWKTYLKNIVIFIATYVVITNGVMGIIQKSNLITNAEPDDYLWKFVLGLNSTSSGKWNLADFNMVYDGSLTLQERKQLELKLIKERITQNNLLRLWKEKTNIYWNNFEYFWTVGYTQEIQILGKQIKTEDAIILARCIDKTIWGAMVIFAFIGLFHKKKKAMILYAILIGSFLIYLWIEVQGRYAYYTDILMCIIAALGIDVIVKYIHKRKKEKIHAED